MTRDEKPGSAAASAAIDPAGGTTSRLAAPDVALGILIVTAVLVGLDVVSDLRAGGTSAHVALELATLAIALAGSVALWAQLLRARRRARTLERDLVRAEADVARFREESRDHLRGLGEAIGHQFARWQLSGAEREVALLLLRGLALKEIAASRDTSERTVRQQALSVYRKAGLAGRAELSAFFLEELLAPGTDAAGGDGRG